ncbi:hypothetical protein RN001_005779 [Aquatica leii]|uniref:DDE Tnp4 domain-containing protein n=1 Tax=Aquatica leii TaxID=1421715 RepID=A0AAN7P708_9COLE|nr:hypothetical protein RN001_005779 [Aquatica leii]
MTFVLIILNFLFNLLKRQSRELNRNLRDTSDPFQLTEDLFQKLYRLNREVAFELFRELEPFMEVTRRNTRIPKVVKFTTALHFFAHGSYQKPVGKDYHCSLSQASVSRCLNEIMGIINEHLIHRYIRFPTTLQDITRVKNGFYEKFDFPGVLGCIDCTHIAITPPPANDLVNPAHVFMNRKGFYSINCQIICDADLKILAINARYPGSVHDSAIWMLSNIKSVLSRNYFQNNDHGTWLLGDSGYPLQPFLLTPIIGANGNTPEGRYTRRHSKKFCGTLHRRFKRIFSMLT